MAFTKITEADVVNKGVTGLPDTPNLSTMEMQEKFDELTKDVMIPKFNNLVDELEETEIEKRIKSEDITNVRLNEDNNIEVSIDNGKTFKQTASSGHIIMDGTGRSFPQRSRMQYSANVVVTDIPEDNTTFMQVPSGVKGDKGDSATITVGNVESSEIPYVNNVGSQFDAIFDFGIPKGQDGNAATIQVGTVTSGDNPSVSNRGTSAAAIFDFVLPKGEKGDSGTSFQVLGMYPTYDDLIAAHPTGNRGDAYAVGNATSNVVYNWNNDTREWDNLGGLKGVKGEDGKAATVTIGTVSEGTTPSVENVGTTENAILNFTLQKGEKGDTGNAATIAVGNVERGDVASVTNVGTNTNAVFDFTIPKGDKGDPGEPSIVNGKSGESIVLYGYDMFLKNYKKENYSEITDDDSVQSAIQKLDGKNSGGALIRVSCADEFAGNIITLSMFGQVKQTAVVPTVAPYKVEFSAIDLGNAIITNEREGISTQVEITTYTLYEAGLFLGSIALTVTEDFIGKEITCTDGITTKTWLCDGLSHIFSVGLGEWTISATLDGQLYSTSVNVTDYVSYSTMLTRGDIIIKVTYDDDFVGKVVKCTNGTKTFTATPGSVGGLLQFIVNDEGEWSVKATIDDKEYTKTVNVSHGNTYDVKLVSAKGFNYEGWLEAGGVTKTFNSLEEVLADQTTIRTLINKHASVDYLANSCDEESAATIFNAYYVIKWVNLRDYALDTLSAIDTIKSVMDEVGLYGYGEVTLGNVVPKMTSNTAPSGECSGSKTNTQFYYAFDGNASTYWGSGDSANQFIQYKFAEPTMIMGVNIISKVDGKARIKNYKVLASNDGTSWTELLVGTFEDTQQGVFSAYFPNSQKYLYYRLLIVDTYAGNIWLDTVEFLAPTLKGCVPTMTSNTAPYGEALSSGVNASYQNYYAFDKNEDTRWTANASATNGHWLGYKFANPISVSKVKHTNVSNSDNTFKVEYSDDGANWTSTDIQYVVPTKESKETDVPYNGYHLYWRVYKVDGGSNSSQTSELQFYGRTLKVSVPTMSSNTEPWGEAIASSTYSGYEPYSAFDKKSNTFWNANNSEYGSYNMRIGYSFDSEVVVKYFMINSYESNTKVKLVGSNDKANWVELTEELSFPSKNKEYRVSVDNNTPYKHYALKGASATNPIYFAVYEANFYGLDYSEHEERHWIYDHGVEVEEIADGKTEGFSYSSYTMTSVEKHESYIQYKTDTGTFEVALNKNPIDLSPYSLVRSFVTDGVPNVAGSTNYANINILVWAVGDKHVTSNLAVVSTKEQSIYLGIGQVNQDAYVCLGGGTPNGIMASKIEEIWLE